MEYVCTDPQAKARAPRLLALVESFQLFPSVVDQLLERNGLTRAMFETHEYVPMTTAIGLIRDIRERIGPEKARQFGRKAVEMSLFPPQLDSVESVLLALDMIYALNHLGEVGHYRVTRKPDGAIEVRCATPYPREFERGLIEGIALNRSLTRGRTYVVDYEETLGHADETCVCTVRER